MPSALILIANGSEEMELSVNCGDHVDMHLLIQTLAQLAPSRMTP
jgi:hypothetical protein